MPRKDKRERFKRTERLSIRPHELTLPVERGEFSVRCGKVAYRDRGEAEEALAIIFRFSRSHRRPQQVYPCWICDGFHLTSKPIKTKDP